MPPAGGVTWKFRARSDRPAGAETIQNCLDEVSVRHLCLATKKQRSLGTLKITEEIADRSAPVENRRGVGFALEPTHWISFTKGQLE
jgi:hypothetical protein